MAGVGGVDGKTAEKLGYLGLGMMGFPMTHRLLNAGYDVVVWNRSAGKAALLVEAGAKLKAHPRDVASSASILFMCVTDATAVEAVVFDRDGRVLLASKPDPPKDDVPVWFQRLLGGESMLVQVELPTELRRNLRSDVPAI